MQSSFVLTVIALVLVVVPVFFYVYERLHKHSPAWCMKKNIVAAWSIDYLCWSCVAGY